MMLSRITLRQMRYFVAAAERGSITLASEKIHVSSPTISAAIAHIETELAVQLFIRQHAKGLILTEIGAQVRDKCLAIMREMDGLYSMVDELSADVRGELKLGCFSAFAPMIYTDVIHEFGVLHQQVNVRLRVGHQKMLLDQLMLNSLDVALVYDLNIDTHYLQFERLASLPPYALLGASHPFAQAPDVSLAELSCYPMVMLDMPHSQDYFVELFRGQGLSPNIVSTSASIELMRTMVANHVGYSILNVRAKLNYALDGQPLVCVPIRDALRPMYLGVARAKNMVMNTVTKAFMQHCQTLISDEVIPGMCPLVSATTEGDAYE